MEQAKCTYVSGIKRHLTLSKTMSAQSTTRIEVLARINRLKEYLANYETVQAQIDETCGEEQLAYQIIEREQTDELYMTALINFETLLSRFADPNPISPPQDSPARYIPVHVEQPRQIKLPTINLPKFSGKYEDWPSFSDLFKTLIHDSTSLSNTEKLHYLKSNINETVAELIKSLPISDTNYTEAWNILETRYNHKRFIIDAHLNLIFKFKSIQNENATQLRHLRDTFSETIRALHSLNQPTESWDCLLNHLLVSKFDPETHRHWELSLSRTELPTFKQILEFLDKRWQCLEMVPHTSSIVSNSTTHRNNSRINTHKVQSLHVKSTGQLSCAYCKQEHSMYYCPQFSSIDINSKLQFLRNNNLCFNCLRKGHGSAQCTSSNCRVCHKKHNTLIHNHNNLQSTNQQPQARGTPIQSHPSQPSSQQTYHVNNKPSQTNQQAEASSSSSQSTVMSHMVCNTSHNNVLLSTATVIIQTNSGNHRVRALVDTGSQASFVTEALVQRIGLQKQQTSITVNGLGLSKSSNSTSKVSFTLLSCNKNFSVNMEALTISKITSHLPSSSFDKSMFQHINNLSLADPEYNTSSKIDLLLGAEIYSIIIMNGLVKGPVGSPVAQQTQLGWILLGNVLCQNTNQNVQNFLVRTDPLDEQLKRFWEIEELSPDRTFNAEELECERHFNNTHQRTQDGRFIVELPFKDTRSEFGNSKDIAVTRLKQVERRLAQKPELRVAYNNFMDEFLKLGHMELIPEDEINRSQNESYYLPHHCVEKSTSTTTKVRVVFDGSAKTSTCVSLNDTLMVGPTIQHDLFRILIRWRKHQIVFIADIEKMYRQILVSKKDTDYQRVVWRNLTSDPIREYRLLTVTYGTSSAPYLAIKSLRQLAQNNQEKFPLGADIALRDFYVDDLISGCDDIHSAIIIKSQLTSMLQDGGFTLRKWCSNSTDFIQEIPVSHRETSETSNIFDFEQSIKTLGVKWNFNSDKFAFKIHAIVDHNPTTKRILCSEIAKLFDPLGWLSPTTILGKIMLQHLWIAGISWDDPIPENMKEDWLSFKHQLNLLESIRIDRWIGYSSKQSNLQLHGFSDASTSAYAAVVYARVTTSYDTKITILAARTKVAPVKTISVPRLELCGALLLARLINKVSESLECKDLEILAWTDSTIVLAWLRSLPNRWTTFIANRVTEVQTLTNINQWRFVSTHDNPADCASRGVLPFELVNHSLWWSGPSWLSQNQSEWPSQPTNMETQLEIKCKGDKVLSLVTSTSPDLILELIERYSSIHKLKHIFAYCKRFINNAQINKINRNIGHLTTTELDEAFVKLIQVVQASHFGDEIERCQSNEGVLAKSKLKTLHPFLDDNNLLRVGGRLENSGLSFDKKHPVILPQKSNLTNLLVLQAHSITLHGGPKLMMGHLTEKFWILGVRRLVRNCVHRCMTCFRINAKSSQQLMGSLPKVRVTPARPFVHSGVDYAGPVTLRHNKGRGQKTFKGYIAVFVCLVTKAIHLELVSDLQSTGFIAAFKRFVSRRGRCTDLYSDCGTNFVGANKILLCLHNQSIQQNTHLLQKLADDGTKWHFIPPASPHMGGLWEAGVKSIKHHLVRIVGNTTLTFEEFYTVLVQIEACLNSRPLCPLSNDVNDVGYLSPAHFLIGESMITTPEPSLLLHDRNQITRWQYTSQLVQQFWKVWSAEYISRLQQRPKWLTPNLDFKVGQLVLVKDERLPPSMWVMARILQLHPGQDGLTRVVTLKCRDKNVKRPITKISILPTTSADESIEGNPSTRAECSASADLNQRANSV